MQLWTEKEARALGALLGDAAENRKEEAVGLSQATLRDDAAALDVRIEELTQRAERAVARSEEAERRENAAKRDRIDFADLAESLVLRAEELEGERQRLLARERAAREASKKATGRNPLASDNERNRLWASYRGQDGTWMAIEFARETDEYCDVVKYGADDAEIASARFRSREEASREAERRLAEEKEGKS